MNIPVITSILLGSLIFAIVLGRCLSHLLPEHHLGSDTKDTVKLSMGLIATMTALLLGLLVSSAKDTYDSAKQEVTQMAAKISFLDRILKGYGPETEEFRIQFRSLVKKAVDRIWPDKYEESYQYSADPEVSNIVFLTIQSLTPRDDAQRSLKAQAVTLILELGQIQSVLMVQSVRSISKPLLIMVICWLFVIFLSFSMISPRNAIATITLIVSALSVTGAVFLILELDHPFSGILKISSEPLLNALNLISK